MAGALGNPLSAGRVGPLAFVGVTRLGVRGGYRRDRPFWPFATWRRDGRGVWPSFRFGAVASQQNEAQRPSNGFARKLSGCTEGHLPPCASPAWLGHRQCACGAHRQWTALAARRFYVIRDKSGRASRCFGLCCGRRGAI